MPPIDARFVYLTLFPYTPPAKTPGGGQAPPLDKNQSPYFLDLDMEVLELGRNSLTIDDVAVEVRRQVFDEEVILVECSYALPDILNPACNERKQNLQTKLLATIRAESGYAGPFLEEYTIVCISAITAGPDDFVEANRLTLAGLLRNVPRAINETETDQILASRARYTDHDLVVVDWEGALLIDPNQDFRSDIQLLKIGNYELIRYRLLDRAIERNLQMVRDELESKRRLNFFSNVVREALEQRLALLLDFEKTEQLLLLIGDWYSAQLYRIIVDEFYIDDWKNTVKSKIEQLESITDIIHENFSVSWRQTLDIIQLVGWLVLLAGYFILFYLELSHAILP